MSFTRYPAYKDSGVEWLGEVPGHWVVTALKRGFQVTLGKMLQPESANPDDELLPYLRAANIQWDGVDTDDIKNMWMSARDRTQLALKKGDLLISEGGDVGRSCLWNTELEVCYFQNSVNRVRALEGNSNRYLYYWMSVVKDKGYVDVLCNKSTIAHFTAEKVAAVPVPFPPANEQQAIATFLDLETAKIDGLMAEQRALVALLKEKRQAVISYAVTKGLNPAAPMKDSGVAWLGEVPGHWEVTKAGRYLSILSGFAFPSTGFSIDESDTKLLRGINVGVSEIKWDQTVYWPRADADGLEAFELSAGDIVIGMDRPWISEGVRVARISENDLPCLLLQRVAALSTFEKLNSDYLFELLSSQVFVNYFSPDTTGVSVPHISPSQISNFLIPIPPIAEQKVIVTFINHQTTQIDTLTQEAQTTIALLQERRTALISAAVTGKMDVRAAVAA